MKKHKLKKSVCAIASACFLLLSATAFNAAAAEPPVEEEEASNNLSVPVIFAEGYGMTGFPAPEKSGLPGGLTPTWGTAYCYQNTEYFLQATDSLWQAQWSADALIETEPQPVSVTVDWSDEVVKKVWNEKSVIPVGVTLYKEPVGISMIGYEMTSLPAGILPCDSTVLPEETDTSVVITSEEEVDEIWGTTGYTYESDRATVYSICPRLTIQKISESGDLQEPIFDSAVYEGFGVTGKPDWYSATIDGAGKIVYLYNWNLALMQEGPDVDRSGWYRLSFSLDGLDEKITYTITQGKFISKEEISVSCNTSLDALDTSDATGVTYAPVLVTSDQKTYVDIYISQETTGE